MYTVYFVSSLSLLAVLCTSIHISVCVISFLRIHLKVRCELFVWFFLYLCIHQLKLCVCVQNIQLLNFVGVNYTMDHVNSTTECRRINTLYSVVRHPQMIP